MESATQPPEDQEPPQAPTLALATAQLVLLLALTIALAPTPAPLQTRARPAHSKLQPQLPTTTIAPLNLEATLPHMDLALLVAILDHMELEPMSHPTDLALAPLLAT